MIRPGTNAWDQAFQAVAKYLHDMMQMMADKPDQGFPEAHRPRAENVVNCLNQLSKHVAECEDPECANEIMLWAKLGAACVAYSAAELQAKGDRLRGLADADDLIKLNPFYKKIKAGDA